MMFFINVISTNNVISRFDINDENTISVRSRVNQITTAYDLLKQKPFGVGLGNYYEYLPAIQKNQNYAITNKLQKQESILAEENIHNIFGLIAVESGILGFAVFILFIALCVRNDVLLFFKKKHEKIPFVIAFWSMFIYSLFNPLIPGVTNYLFWFLRGYLLFI